MQKISAWLFLLIAIVWLLPLIGVDALVSVSGWIQTVALAIIAIMEIAQSK